MNNFGPSFPQPPLVPQRPLQPESVTETDAQKTTKGIEAFFTIDEIDAIRNFQKTLQETQNVHYITKRQLAIIDGDGFIRSTELERTEASITIGYWPSINLTTDHPGSST